MEIVIQNNMKLTDNFTLEELIKSSTATKLNIDNNPTEEITSNLLELSTKILQQLEMYMVSQQ